MCSQVHMWLQALTVELPGQLLPRPLLRGNHARARNADGSGTDSFVESERRPMRPGKRRHSRCGVSRGLGVRRCCSEETTPVAISADLCLLH